MNILIFSWRGDQLRRKWNFISLGENFSWRMIYWPYKIFFSILKERFSWRMIYQWNMFFSIFKKRFFLENDLSVEHVFFNIQGSFFLENDLLVENVFPIFKERSRKMLHGITHLWVTISNSEANRQHSKFVTHVTQSISHCQAFLKCLSVKRVKHLRIYWHDYSKFARRNAVDCKWYLFLYLHLINHYITG